MTCEEYQREISMLVDGELDEGRSGAVFGHLGACGECRRFYYQVQNLHAALEQVRTAGVPASAPLRQPQPARRVAPVRRFWSNRITLRLPVAAALVVVFALALFFSVQRGLMPGEQETVYLTKLPPVVVTASESAK